jgi:hypothetical protein
MAVRLPDQSWLVNVKHRLRGRLLSFWM